MNMNTWNDTLQATRNSITQLEMAAESLKHVLLGQGYIVRCEGLCLAFTIEAGKVSNPVTAQPQMATRFSLRDAEAVAADVKNGNGTAGEAVHVTEAVRDALEGQRELLALLVAHTEKQST